MLDFLSDLKITTWDKVRFHLEVLSIGEKDIRSFLSSPYRIVLIILFTVLFLPHVFVAVEDISLLRAYEVDPGSIVASIESLYQHPYNMNIPYHARYYGWTYYSINFILLAPVYILSIFKVIHGYYFFLVSVRFIFFLIGLASVLAFFQVARRFLNHDLLSFLASLLFIASPAVSIFFYFLHPETTGLLFLFLALLCLSRFHEISATDLRWYTFGLLCLTLSILSKHTFVFTALPVFFLFLYIYCYHHNISVFRFMLSREFVKALLGSLAFSVFIFFIINPFAFLQPRTFLTNQMLLFSTQTHGSTSEAEATAKWLDILGSMPVLYVSIILSPLSILGALFWGAAHKVGRMLYMVNIISATLFTLFSVISLRYIIYEGYLSPIYAFFILNILGTALFIARNPGMRHLKFLTFLTLTYFVFLVLLRDFSASLPTEYARLTYQDSLAYKSYQYIETHIPDGKKIAYDHLVAIPSDMGIIGCQYWQGCGTDYIEEFHPDYVIFSDDWTFGGTKLAESLRLEKYVKDHHFILTDRIEGTDPGPGQVESNSLEVWKSSGD